MVSLINHYIGLKGKDDGIFIREYTYFLRIVVCYYVTDILWGILYEYNLIGLCYFDTVLYFIFMALSILFWTQFVVIYLKEQNQFKTFLLASGEILLVVEIVVLIINFFVPIFFTFVDGVYEAGYFRYILLIFQVIMYFLVSIYAFYVYWNRDRKPRFAIIGITSFCMIVFIVIQTLYPLYPMYAIGCLFSTSMMRSFVIEDARFEYQRRLEKLLRENEEKTKELQKAHNLAHTDPLTGVKNKLSYLEKEDEINDRISKHIMKNFAIVIFDIDNLKTINDTNGHDAGDTAIKTACDKIVKVFSPSLVYRIGGDEFMTFLFDENYNNRNQLIKEFDRQMKKHQKENKPIVSCGISEYNLSEDEYCQDIFDRADQYMYEKKNKNKSLKR